MLLVLRDVELLLDLKQALVEVLRLIETQAHVVALDVVLNVLSALLFLEVLREIKLSLKYRFDLILIEPFNSLSIFPQAGLRVAPRHLIQAEAVLFASKPHPLVHAMISPRVDAEAVFLVVTVLALVPTPILPGVNTHALHVVVEPFALIFAAI